MTITLDTGKTNILYVIDCLNIGGTEKQLVEIIGRLDRQKFEPHLCCLRDSEYLRKLDLECNVLVLKLGSLISFKGLYLLVNLSQYIRAKNIHIVQTFFIDANIVGTIAARLGGAGIVISSRREMVYWYTRKILFSFNILKPFTTRYLANSFSVRDHVSIREKIPKDRIDVLHNGIDLSRYSAVNGSDIRNEMGVRRTDAIVGIVSNLNRPVKRVDVFLMGAAEVLSRGVSALFVIVGDGYLREELRCLAETLGIADHVRFVGSKENVVPYIQSFNVGVNSSESEGFSNAVLEYMACSVPVVATNFGGSSESVIHRQTGLLVTPNDHLELANAIVELLRDPERAKNMGHQGRNHVKMNFDCDVVMEKLEQYYRDMVRNKNAVCSTGRST